MSRSGYSEDCDDTLMYGRWRGQVLSATRGIRGQAFFTDLLAALEEMPEKRLITDELQQEDGEVCALGALGVKRGIDLQDIDPEDSDCVAERFNIASQLAAEVVYENDEGGRRGETPEERWTRVHAWVKKQIIIPRSGSIEQKEGG